MCSFGICEACVRAIHLPAGRRRTDADRILLHARSTAAAGQAHAEGGTLGYRVVHFYFPRSGIIIALAVNSATDPNTNDDLQLTAIAVYQTLLKAGVAHSG